MAHQLVRRLDFATTGYWYVRLCRAVVGAADRRGALSGPFADLPVGLRERAIAALLELPEEIDLLSLRQLAPDIGRLRQRHALNILGMEVLAVAIRLRAEVVLSTPAPRLVAALVAEQCRYRVLG